MFLEFTMDQMITVIRLSAINIYCSYIFLSEVEKWLQFDWKFDWFIINLIFINIFFSANHGVIKVSTPLIDYIRKKREEKKLLLQVSITYPW